MIKLFRKIRLKLLSENKLSKYLVYAIGEIVLVVIGILIALQINNWNETKKSEKRITGYMENLVDDIKSDVKEFNENIKYYQYDIEQNKRIITSDDYKLLGVDSIVKLTGYLYLIDRTTRQTYEKIKNEGVIESLGSEKINKAVSDYYNLDIIYYQNMLKWDKEETSESLNFWFYNKDYESSSTRNYNTNALPFLTSSEKRKTDLITLIESVEGRNHIRNNLIRKKHLLKKVREIKQAAKSLIEELTLELNER